MNIHWISITVGYCQPRIN